MTKGAYAYEKDVPKMITEDYPIACCACVAFRGLVKIEFDEIFWGRRPTGGASRWGGTRGGGGGGAEEKEVVFNAERWGVRRVCQSGLRQTTTGCG
jgi:hypothetical protein